MNLRVLFRTDAGAGIGLGHLQRSISLAAALGRSGAVSFFEVFGDGGSRATEAGFGAEELSEEPASAGDVAATSAAAKRWECNAVVVDSYLITADYLDALRAAGLYVVAIDDLNEFAFGVQMVVSIGPHAPGAGYTSSSGDTQFLLGPRYTILRQEFWDTPGSMPSAHVHNVLVTTGGADPECVMPPWLRLLDGLDGSFSVTAIVGPFFRNAAEVHAAAAECARTVRVIESPAVMRPLMANADVALSAAGQTIYELAGLGVPTVAVEIAPNQAPQLRAFGEIGAMRDAGRAQDDSANERISGALGSIIQNRAEREQLSEIARTTVNRKGALLVAEAICKAAG